MLLFDTPIAVSTFVSILASGFLYSIWLAPHFLHDQVCEERLRARTFPSFDARRYVATDTFTSVLTHRQRLAGTGHPTITSFEQGRSVLHRFRSQFEPPYPQEGYDQFLRLALSDQPSDPTYTMEAVGSILQRLQEAPRMDRVVLDNRWGSWRSARERASGRGFNYNARRGSGFGPYGARGGRGGYTHGGEGHRGHGYSESYATSGRGAHRGTA